MLDDMSCRAGLSSETLWNVDEAGEALETAERFVSLSLAQRANGCGWRDPSCTTCNWTTYARSTQTATALDLIHGAIRLPHT